MSGMNLINSEFLQTLELLLKFFGGIGGLTLFFIGLLRYRKEQIWRRGEFIAKEMKDFNSDKMIRNVMYMLDWSSRKIELFPDKCKYEDRYETVTKDILKNALMFHELRIKDSDKDRFSEVEVAIRDHFDHFFNQLERFEQFIESEIVSIKEIKPYISYWIEAISKDIDETTRETIYNFINEYNFKGTQNLFKRFGKDISPKIKSSKLISSQSKQEQNL